MPSSPGYKRDYVAERKTMLARGENVRHPLRLRARRLEMKKGLVHPHDGKQVDHKQPLSKGGSGAESNLRVISAHANESYPRTHTGAIKGKG